MFRTSKCLFILFCYSCIFLSGNGAFFVNYVITSAFIGSALELLRFSELFVYGMKLLMARSSAERTSVRKVNTLFCKTGRVRVVEWLLFLT